MIDDEKDVEEKLTSVPQGNMSWAKEKGWKSTAKCPIFDFYLTTDDSETNLEKYFQEKALPLVVFFYCSFAANCYRPAKTFSRNAEKMAGKAAFLLLNCDPMTPADKGCWAKEFAKKNGIAHCDHGYVDDKNDKMLCKAYNVTYIPHYTIFWLNGLKMVHKNADSDERFDDKCYMYELQQAVDDHEATKRKAEEVASTPKARKRGKIAGEISKEKIA